MKTLRRWTSVAIAALATTVLAVGISFGATDPDPHQPDLAILDQPPSKAPLPDRVGDVAFERIHFHADLDQRRLARRADDSSFFVVPGKRAGDICLLAVAQDDSASSTCNPPTVLEDYGAIPILSFGPGGGISVAAIVTDRITAVSGDDGSVGTVEGNVMLIEVGPTAESIELASAEGVTSFDLSSWRDPQ